jgi:hypothetical protein
VRDLGASGIFHLQANVNKPEDDGWTPLMLACLGGVPSGETIAKFLQVTALLFLLLGADFVLPPTLHDDRGDRSLMNYKNRTSRQFGPLHSTHPSLSLLLAA